MTGKKKPAAARSALPRRAVLGGAGSGLAGLALGFAAGGGGREEPARADGGTDAPVAVPVFGAHQAGIARPATPQTFCALAVLEHTSPGASSIGEIGAAAGRAVRTATSPETCAEAGLLDGPGDLTVTIAVGPRLVAALDDTLPGATALPLFQGDEAIPAERRDGDVLVIACSSDANDAATALQHVTGALPSTRLRWTQRGFRARGQGTITRNPLGFHDGVIVPRRPEELDENVWIPSGPAANGTNLVVRRLRLDTSAFHTLPHEGQERVIGRRRTDGAPLSGGGPTDEVNLLAKTPEGELLVPAHSHARAAHPSFTGSHLMLRRGYAFDDGRRVDESGLEVHDAGLLFLCYQREQSTYVRTQHRLDEVDDLMDYVTPTASGSFLVLPGFDDDRPMGSTLAGA
ncbi:Dyp-type peroxidase [Pseudactinotalea suaedae]|uniref:Dyp-type peroxidase n=1 Tax=Pseudactinotalea suaedae TaxID=1524924 RepID=UPI0012E21623|nr:Dyp-type peroxidase [Pseudactinotalea suaedae]